MLKKNLVSLVSALAILIMLVSCDAHRYSAILGGNDGGAAVGDQNGSEPFVPIIKVFGPPELDPEAESFSFSLADGQTFKDILECPDNNVDPATSFIELVVDEKGDLSAAKMIFVNRNVEAKAEAEPLDSPCYNQLTFVDEEHLVITVSGGKENKLMYTYDKEQEVFTLFNQYTISASAAAPVGESSSPIGGVVSPTSATGHKGFSQQIIITPSEGYKLGNVVVDDQTLNAVQMADVFKNGYYEFKDIKKDHTLIASFKADVVVPPLSNLSAFTEFYLNGQAVTIGDYMGGAGGSKSLRITMSCVSLDGMIATFSTNSLAANPVSIGDPNAGGVPQESGVTANNFVEGFPYIYWVVAEDGSSTYYELIITLGPCECK